MNDKQYVDNYSNFLDDETMTNQHSIVLEAILLEKYHSWLTLQH